MVQLKKKVTLKTKISNHDTIVPTESNLIDKNLKTEKTPETTNPRKRSESKGKLWIIVLVACALLLGGYFVFSSDDDSQIASRSNDGKPTVENLDNKDIPKDQIEPKRGIPSEIDSQSPNAKPESPKVEETKANENSVASSVPTKRTEPMKNPSTKVTAQSKYNQLNGTLEQKANAVIRGDYGNGLERKQKLGSEYTEIQNKVNEMYKNGQVD